MIKRVYGRTIIVLILIVVFLNVQVRVPIDAESTIPISLHTEMMPAQLSDKNIISIDTLKLGSDYVDIDGWILAATLMIPLLIIYGDAIALLGAALIENLKGDVSYLLFFNNVFDILEYSDINPAIIKSIFFGFAIGLVGCFKGYNCERGTVGVGEASNSAVVFTSMLLFVIDFIAVFVTDIFYS